LLKVHFDVKCNKTFNDFATLAPIEANGTVKVYLREVNELDAMPVLVRVAGRLLQVRRA
jgi:hypothetical protein